MVENPPARKYTPALKYSILTPIYDLSLKLFTRETTWRNKLIQLTDPRPGERILDLGCGTGSNSIWIKKKFPECEVVGIDPDAKALELAERKSRKLNLDIHWIQGFIDEHSRESIGEFSKVVSSLVLHQTSTETKKNILVAAKSLLVHDGRLCIADYGIQSTLMMKVLYRLIVQTIDGYSDTQPNAEGYLTQCLSEIGFAQVTQECEYHTLTGSIALLVAS